MAKLESERGSHKKLPGKDRMRLRFGEGKVRKMCIFAAECSQKAKREEGSVGTCILPGSLSFTTGASLLPAWGFL